MVVRPFTILCSVLIAACPSLLWAELAAHAREHVQAVEAGHGHSHPDGHAPHHQHDQDGGPVPVSEPTATFTARLTGYGANALVQCLTLEQSSLTPPPAFDAGSRVLSGSTEGRSMRPPGPSPGNNLPLLI